MVTLLFPVNVCRPKFAAAGLPTNLRNAQPVSFFFLPKRSKVNVNSKNWAVLRWLLLYLKEKDFFTIFEVSRNYCVN